MPNIEHANEFLKCFRHNPHFRYHVDDVDDDDDFDDEVDFIYRLEVTIQKLKLTTDFKAVGSRLSPPLCTDFESWPPLEWVVAAPDMYGQSGANL
jgi:hypothetical protein